MTIAITQGIAHDTSVYCRCLKFNAIVKAGTSHEDFGNIVMVLGGMDSDFRQWRDEWIGVSPQHQPVRIDAFGYATVVRPL